MTTTLILAIAVGLAIRPEGNQLLQKKTTQAQAYDHGLFVCRQYIAKEKKPGEE